MNFTSRIKQSKYPISKSRAPQPKYVLNLCIDIPIHPKCIGDLPNSNHISTQRLKRKINLTTTPVRAKKDSLTSQIHLQIPTFRKAGAHSKIEKNSKLINHYKYPSCQLNPKKTRKKSIIHSARQAKLLEELDQDTSIIRYTNQSSQQKLKSLGNDGKILKLQTKGDSQGLINLSEIRKFQMISKQKKQHLNYMYLKQKILILASVKKIQRAWRNYRTRKILKMYSLTQKSISQRILQKQLKKDKTEQVLSQLSLSNRSNGSNFQIQSEKVRSVILHSETSQNDQDFVEFESSQIQKWDQLIDQIRSGKSINQILENSCSRRKQLQKELQKFNGLRQQPLSSASGRSSVDFELNMQKIKKIQAEIRKFQLQNSENDDMSSEEYHYVNIPQSHIEQQLEETEEIKKKLIIFDHLNSIAIESPELSEDSICNQGKPVPLQQPLPKIQKNFKDQVISQSSKKDDILNPKQCSLQSTGGLIIEKQKQAQKQQSKNQQSIKENALKKQLNNLGLRQKLEFCKLLVQQLVYQCLLDFSDSEKIVSIIKPLFEKQTIKKVQKLEGICTNLQSIKDYLQNLASYIVDNHLTDTFTRLNTPIEASVKELLRNIITKDYSKSQQSNILDMDIFNNHWNFVSEQIYFDRKYQDQSKENQRIVHLKNLTNIYFRAIFDAFNQSMNFQRVYSILGKPLPWKPSLNIQSTVQVNNAMKKSYERIISLSVVYCGLFFNSKKASVPDSVVKQVQDERLKQLIYLQLIQGEPLWNNFSKYETEILLDISKYVSDKLFTQMLTEINTFTF